MEKMQLGTLQNQLKGEVIPYEDWCFSIERVSAKHITQAFIKSNRQKMLKEFESVVEKLLTKDGVLIVRFHDKVKIYNHKLHGNGIDRNSRKEMIVRNMIETWDEIAETGKTWLTMDIFYPSEEEVEEEIEEEIEEEVEEVIPCKDEDLHSTMTILKSIHIKDFEESNEGEFSAIFERFANTLLDTDDTLLIGRFGDTVKIYNHKLRGNGIDRNSIKEMIARDMISTWKDMAKRPNKSWLSIDVFLIARPRAEICEI
jgi:hypothetical protein